MGSSTARLRIPYVRLTFALLIGILAMMISGSVAQQEAAAAGKVDVLIGFKSTPGTADEALVRRGGGSIKARFHLVPAIAASVPESAIPGLLRNPRVTVIEPDGRFFAVDAELDSSWGVKKIGAGTVHDGGNKGANIKVAIIDTGIDYNHPDLAANYAGGRDFVNNDTNPMDDNGHGTHVAGTVAARDNGVGVVGAAPEAKLYALKVLNASGSGSFSNVIAALQWARDNGMQVTNNSYGSKSDPGTIVRQAFDNAGAAGVLHIAAAGNSGNCAGKNNSVGYPARYASVVAVAATDAGNKRACFSSTGPDVEISAPGVSINSTRRGGGYTVMSGTSMASPHVAGAAALVIADGITDVNGNGRINDEVRTRLDSTATDLGKAGRDPQYGYGLVNAVAATAP